MNPSLLLQAGAFEDGLPALQSISEEDSNNSGQSYTTFSPFRWPMPVSPSAFPVQQVALNFKTGSKQHEHDSQGTKVHN